MEAAEHAAINFNVSVATGPLVATQRTLEQEGRERTGSASWRIDHALDI